MYQTRSGEGRWGGTPAQCTLGAGVPIHDGFLGEAYLPNTAHPPLVTCKMRRLLMPTCWPIVSSLIDARW